MKAVIQRVSNASVHIAGKLKDEIGTGLLILLGVGYDDDNTDIEWLVNKIVNLRVFNDEQGTMNLSLDEVDGEAIIVSQFTLLANTKKGNRPSYIKAARPEIAIPIYEEFIKVFESRLGKKVGTGVFGADMQIDLQNDGPVTLVIDTKNKG